MPKLPKTLQETVLWETYIKKTSEEDVERKIWVEKVYDTASESLKCVRDTFPNYTLHDERHVLNVIYAMGAILGDQIDNLTVGEIELLILAASLHDIGMVYTEADKHLAFNDERGCRMFLREKLPEFIGICCQDWQEDTKQYYLRELHPFRIDSVLQSDEWRNVFDKRPRSIVSEQVIVSVCRAHGENIDEIRNNEELSYISAQDVEPLFCAMLLRLADLLDFDDTRTPRILLDYAAGNEQSLKEWRKHMASLGFVYPQTPSKEELVYSAECTTPGEEYSIREFLDWIDDELRNCAYVQKLYQNAWQRDFPFPKSVSRKEIKGVGYVSDEFKLTMDQEQILKLLSGEKLYESNDVFIRELIQNAIDATLLRGKMEKSFEIENARIDLWEWTDSNGNTWFRIDDQGTGMTLGMLKRYFLKVGNSYYTSKELKRDILTRGSAENFHGISRFGIGFLSSFLCGKSVDVSTLYFDETKSLEEDGGNKGKRNGYGIRLDITGLKGYYTLRSQAEGHIINDSLPAPNMEYLKNGNNLEYRGYRSKPGTSIAIMLDPGKLGVRDLKEAAKNYICGARIPIYYNGERIGRTYSEIMEKAHELSGRNIYEIPLKKREEYDKCFPQAKGNYPKIILTVIPLDKDDYKVLPNLSGVFVKYEAQFENMPQWNVRDQQYTIQADFNTIPRFLSVGITNIKEDKYSLLSWNRSYVQKYGLESTDRLKKVFEKYEKCPGSTEELGEVWIPFAATEELATVWRAFVDDEVIKKSMYIEIDDNFSASMMALTCNERVYGVDCIYQGVFSGKLREIYSDADKPFDIVFFMEEALSPTVDMGRTKITGLPIEVLVAISGIMCHPDFEGGNTLSISELDGIEDIRISEWLHIKDTDLGKWIARTQNEYVEQIIMGELGSEVKEYKSIRLMDERCNLELPKYSYGGKKVLYNYIMACLQDQYDMTVCYEEGQIIQFEEREIHQFREYYDLFPPLLLCKAKTKQSKKYLCCSDSYLRRCITEDHPFSLWLFENAPMLRKYYSRQFKQIMYSFRDQDVENVIKVVNGFLEQLKGMHGHEDLNIKPFGELTKDDFWSPGPL